MKIARVEITGTSPLSMSKYITAEKLPRELPVDYEKRCWQERIHRDKDGNVLIPPMMLVKSVQNAAGYLGMKIPGMRNATYNKRFRSGVRTNESIVLPMKWQDVPGEWYLVPSDGKPGGGTRVEKCFPVIDEWGGGMTFYITDDIITRDVFQEHLNIAGQLIGIGRFRPQNGGYYGCYTAEIKTWKDV